MDITEKLKKEYKEKCNDIRNTAWNKLTGEQLNFIMIQEKISDKVKLLDKEAKKVYNYITYLKVDKEDYTFINRKATVKILQERFHIEKMSESKLNKMLNYFVEVGLLQRDKFPNKNNLGFSYKYKVVKDEVEMDELW